MQHNMLRMGGGLPLGEGFRSLERSLGSECSPATSYGTHEGGDDLDGVTQANVERHQQMYVRYGGMSEGERAARSPKWQRALGFSFHADLIDRHSLVAVCCI